MSLKMHTFALICRIAPLDPLMNNATVRSLCLHTARPLSIPPASSPPHTLVLFFSSASTMSDDHMALKLSHFHQGKGLRNLPSVDTALIAFFFVFFVKGQFFLESFLKATSSLLSQLHVSDKSSRAMSSSLSSSKDQLRVKNSLSDASQTSLPATTRSLRVRPSYLL